MPTAYAAVSRDPARHAHDQRLSGLLLPRPPRRRVILNMNTKFATASAEELTQASL